jgi:rhodanese-related sulfurtransferase
MESIEVEDARRQIAGGEAQALDVRDDEAWAEAHIPGAVNDVDSLDQGQAVIVVADGDPPEAVTAQLSERGLEVRVLAGGMDAWKDADFTIQPTDDVEEPV